MNSSKYKSIIGLLSVVAHCLVVAGCADILGLNGGREVFLPKDSPAAHCWGRLSPGSRLICTKRRHVFDTGDGKLYTRPFDPTTPYDEGNADIPYRVAIVLKPGDVLIVNRLSHHSVGPTAFETLYCIAPTGDEIQIAFKPSGRTIEPFSRELMLRVGFDVQTPDGKSISTVPWTPPPPPVAPADPRTWRNY